jgi:hypothetical protein
MLLREKEVQYVLKHREPDHLKRAPATPFPSNRVGLSASGLSGLFRYCFMLTPSKPRCFALQHAKILLKSFRSRKMPDQWWTRRGAVESWRDSLLEWLCTFWLLGQGWFSPANLTYLTNYYRQNVPATVFHQTAFLIVLTQQLQVRDHQEYMAYAHRMAQSFGFLFQPLPAYLQSVLKNDKQRVGAHICRVQTAINEAQLIFPTDCSFGQFWLIYYLVCQRLESGCHVTGSKPEESSMFIPKDSPSSQESSLPQET